MGDGTSIFNFPFWIVIVRAVTKQLSFIHQYAVLHCQGSGVSVNVVLLRGFTVKSTWVCLSSLAVPSPSLCGNGLD